MSRLDSLDVRVVWAKLRSPEARANLLLLSTGIGRCRMKPEDTTSLRLPVPDHALASTVAEQLKRAEQMQRQLEKIRRDATQALEEACGIRSEDAESILAAFKPPR